ncbi:AMP-binding protein [Bradyrhizobium manausense]|uniref:AMP-binding protein n=1 Tax=Bradyrhizobium manausense TaxID=989370 RepID=UPI001BAB48D3|nr:AMP-binding protein [Bradyrhizobium manausense]
MKRYGDRPALSLDDHRFTYTEMNSLVSRVARGLQRLGVAPGDRVAVMMPNHPVVPIWFYGALSVGAALVSINALYSVTTIEYMLGDSGAKVILTIDSPESLAKLMPSLERGALAQIVTVSPGVAELRSATKGSLSGAAGVLPFSELLDNDGKFAPPPIDPTGTLAVLQYTGGTTGLPKGAMLTHANMTTNARQARIWFSSLQEGSERVLIPLPFSHISGMTFCLILSVMIAAELVVVPRFLPEDALEILRSRRPTFFGGVPTVFIALLMTKSTTPNDWVGVKAVLCGGAPLPPDVMQAFERATGIRVQQVYGATEMSPVVAIMPAKSDEPLHAVGLPVPGTIVEIRDTSDPTRQMPGGQSGEIVVAGPQVMKGYWKREEETNDSMVDGYFRTGDIGYLDERGYLFIVDRLKDMIIASGYNVYPTNVESAIYSHPAVAEVIVIGVPDSYRGENIKAFVVLRDGHELSLDQLQVHLKDKLSPMEMPRLLEIRARLPKTVVGKLSRLELKKEIRELPSGQ